MTGATPFTRAAGKTGVVSTAVAAAWALTTVPRRGPNPFDVLALTAFVVCGLVALVGVFVRHRRHVWVRPAAVAVVVGIALTLLGHRDVGLLIGPPGALLLWVGVLVAGDLPRRGAALLLVGALGSVEEHIVLDLVGAVGWILLCWAMWREPLPDEAPADLDTPLAAVARHL